MQTFLTIIHVFVCFFLVGVVLLQSGRSGGMGVLSGAATQTVFGGRGAGGFLAKATAVCATLFMLTSASLAYISTSGRDSLARTSRRATPAAAATTPSTTPSTAPSTPTPAPAAAPTAPAAPAANTAGDAAAAPTAPAEGRAPSEAAGPTPGTP